MGIGDRRYGIIAWWVGGAVVLYVVVALAMWRFQDRFLYFPDRALRGDPGDVGLAYTDVVFAAADGVRLHGWLVPAADARHTVLFCHGNAGNISDRLATVRMLNELGLSLLIFDYRGYGRSEGEPDEAGLHADAQAAWRFLTADERVDPRRIIVWGRSLGGAVAAILAAEVGPAALVVESTFTNAADMARRHYGWLPVRWLLRARFDAASAVARAACPKLHFHSPDDEVVPYALGVRLHEAAAPPKRFVDLAGGHNDTFEGAPEAYRRAVVRFLEDLAPGAGAEVQP